MVWKNENDKKYTLKYEWGKNDYYLSYSVYLPNFEQLQLETFLFNIIFLYVRLELTLSEISANDNKRKFIIGNYIWNTYY